MTIWSAFWRDERGVVLSAEAVMVGSVAVLGGLVGLNAAATAVNDEMTEMASAIRSFDQSYVIAGHASCGAWKAGSYYIQPRVEVSLRELCGETETDVVGIRESIDNQRDLIYPVESLDQPPANELPKKQEEPKKKKDKKKAKADAADSQGDE